MKRLPDTELEVMKALWTSGPGTPRAQLDQILAPFGWSPNTINTYLSRLTEKGFLSVHKDGKSNLYTPLVSQEDYLAFDSRAVLDRLEQTDVNALSPIQALNLLDELKRMLEG